MANIEEAHSVPPLSGALAQVRPVRDARPGIRWFTRLACEPPTFPCARRHPIFALQQGDRAQRSPPFRERDGFRHGRSATIARSQLWPVFRPWPRSWGECNTRFLSKQDRQQIAPCGASVPSRLADCNFGSVSRSSPARPLRRSLLWSLAVL